MIRMEAQLRQAQSSAPRVDEEIRKRVNEVCGYADEAIHLWTDSIRYYPSFVVVFVASLTLNRPVRDTATSLSTRPINTLLS